MNIKSFDSAEPTAYIRWNGVKGIIFSELANSYTNDNIESKIALKWNGIYISFLAAYETEFGQEMVKTFGGNIREKVIASIHRELDVEQNGGEVIKGTYKCKYYLFSSSIFEILDTI